MDTSQARPRSTGRAGRSAAPDQEERVWQAGRLEPMPIRKLPDAPPSIHILGPDRVPRRARRRHGRVLHVAPAGPAVRAGDPVAVPDRRHPAGRRHAGDGPLRDGDRGEHLLRRGPGVQAADVVLLRRRDPRSTSGRVTCRRAPRPSSRSPAYPGWSRRASALVLVGVLFSLRQGDLQPAGERCWSC